MESHKGLYFNHFLETHFKINDCLWDEIETIIPLYFEGRVSFTTTLVKSQVTVMMAFLK